MKVKNGLPDDDPSSLFSLLRSSLKLRRPTKRQIQSSGRLWMPGRRYELGI